MTVMHQAISAPLPQDMQHLLNRLQEEGYHYVATLCSQAEAFMEGLRSQDEFAAYVGRCQKLTVQLSRYLRLRRLVLVPYIHDLLGKEEDGHDCRNCGGGCSVRHAGHVGNIREAHRIIRELVFQIQSEGAPAFDAAEYPEDYRMLRLNMVLLINTIMEIVYIEEASLIPMMIDLQQKIGAHE